MTSHLKAELCVCECVNDISVCSLLYYVCSGSYVEGPAVLLPQEC